MRVSAPGVADRGVRLAARPAWPVRVLADRLADAQGALDELEVAEIGVRASFQVSYQQLSDSPDALDRAAAEAFGVLGVLDGPEVGVPVVARLLDRAEKETERVLERLADAQLLETPAPSRYQLHDLVRLYARELARHQHPKPERAAALSRALGFYVATAWQTLALLRPGDYRLALADERWRKGGLKTSSGPGTTALSSGNATANARISHSSGRQRRVGGWPSGNSSSTSGNGTTGNSQVTLVAQATVMAAGSPPGLPSSP
jgi:hypothetical protein